MVQIVFNNKAIRDDVPAGLPAAMYYVRGLNTVIRALNSYAECDIHMDVSRHFYPDGGAFSFVQCRVYDPRSSIGVGHRDAGLYIDGHGQICTSTPFIDVSVLNPYHNCVFNEDTFWYQSLSHDFANHLVRIMTRIDGREDAADKQIIGDIMNIMKSPTVFSRLQDAVQTMRSALPIKRPY